MRNAAVDVTLGLTSTTPGTGPLPHLSRLFFFAMLRFTLYTSEMAIHRRHHLFLGFASDSESVCSVSSDLSDLRSLETALFFLSIARQRLARRDGT